MRIYYHLLMHKFSKDTAIEIIDTKGYLWWKKHLVNFYNVNLTKIANVIPMFLGQEWIKMDKMSNYKQLCIITKGRKYAKIQK